MEQHHEIFAEQNMEPATPISASVSIAANATDVWTAISDAGNLKRLHPFCERNEVERWPGPMGGTTSIITAECAISVTYLASKRNKATT